jgi:hypothetical protein
MKVENTAYPKLQLGRLGALGGGIGNSTDAAMSGKRGWDLAGDTALGAVTGALSDSGLGDARGLTVGAVSGVANSFGGDLINTHQVSVSDVEWAAFSGSLGAAENGFESRISNTSPSGVRRSATPWVFW